MRHCFASLVLGSTVAAAPVGSRLNAAPPCDRVLPETTILYLSTMDLDGLCSHLEQSHLGRLWNDPKMKAFAEHLRHHPDAAWTRAEKDSGTTLGQLRRVATGECVMAKVKLGPATSGEDNYANVFLFDVEGKEAEAKALIAQAEKRLRQRRAAVTSPKVAGVTLHVFDLPVKQGQRTVYFIKDSVLGIAGGLGPIELVLARWPGKQEGSLASRAAFRDVMDRCTKGTPGPAPQLRWFIDPVKLIKRLQTPDPELEGDDDPEKSARWHGFDAVLGAGGVVSFNVVGVDMLHRTSIYAPPQLKGQPYKHTMQAMRFLPSTDFAPPAWISDEVSSYKTLTIDLQNAFKHCNRLYDDLAGNGIEGMLEDMLKDYGDPRTGPGVDIGKEIVARLGDRVMMVGQNITPVSQASEGCIVAFAVKQGKDGDVASAIGRIFKDDDGAKQIRIAGDKHEHVLWKIGSDEGAEEESLLLTSTGIMVFHGHLLYTTDYRWVLRLLAARDDAGRYLRSDKGLFVERTGVRPLAAATAFGQTTSRPNALRDESAWLKTFSHLNRNWQTGYELLRLGKAEDSQSTFACLVIKLLAMATGTTEDSLDVDFAKLPKFDSVKHHLGTCGMIGRNHTNGWLLEGVILPPTE